MVLVVTGTDTGVGKTVVTGLLARGARAEGRSVHGLKPVATGCPDGVPPEDAVALGEAAGHTPAWFASWPAPVAPPRAARLAGRPLDVPGLLAWVRSFTSEVVLVEGAGGWRSPLADGPVDLNALARAAGARVVVVAVDRIGVIGLVRLVVEAVRADGLEVAAVVLTPADCPDASQASNREDLEALVDAPVVSVPRLDARVHAGAVAAGLWRAVRPRGLGRGSG